MSHVVLVAGLGFGDEGKGSTVDHLTRKYKAHTVVRYSGGSQAAHNVITDDGKHHTFSQFGSGTLAGADTHLSRHMLVNPISLFSEEKHLREIGCSSPLDYLTVERKALVTNPFQIAANRLNELSRDKQRHGSCGMGIGETVADALARPEEALCIADLENPSVMREKLVLSCRHKFKQFEGKSLPLSRATSREWNILNDEKGVVDYCVEVYSQFARHVQFVDESYLKGAMSKGTTIFEGAQGVLLDESYGFHPYTTWSNTTFHNADSLLNEAGHRGSVERLGITRTYATRHGAGPFTTEDSQLVIPEAHNGDGDWQQGFRRGHFDLVLFRYAKAVIGHLDGLVLTHVDRLHDDFQVCKAYDWGGAQTWKLNLPTTLKAQEALTNLLFLARPVYKWLPTESVQPLALILEEAAGCPITTYSFGPCAKDKRSVSCPLSISI